MSRLLSCAAALLTALTLAPFCPAAVIVYTTPLAAELNPSPGTGFARVDYDDVAQTMRLRANFSGLVGTTTVAHIHAPTAMPFEGTVGVATTTPTFPGFPTGVMSGSYDMTFDLTQASSWNPSFVTANGGTTATAEAAFFDYMNSGRAYLNIHSSEYTGGEIRGFFVPVPEPASLGLLAAGATGLLLVSVRSARPRAT